MTQRTQRHNGHYGHDGHYGHNGHNRHNRQKELIMSKTETLKEFWGFMKTRKKFWLAPIIIILLLLGILIVLSETSAVAPFIYTLF